MQQVVPRGCTDLIVTAHKSLGKSEKQIKTRSEEKKRDIDNISIEGICLDTNEDLLNHNTAIKSMVLDTFSKLGVSECNGCP